MLRDRNANATAKARQLPVNIRIFRFALEICFSLLELIVAWNVDVVFPHGNGVAGTVLPKYSQRGPLWEPVSISAWFEFASGPLHCHDGSSLDLPSVLGSPDNIPTTCPPTQLVLHVPIIGFIHGCSMFLEVTAPKVMDQAKRDLAQPEIVGRQPS